MSAPSMGHDGLHEYAEHARYRAVVAHDAGNADEVINRPISARLLADLQGKLPVTAPSSVRADQVDRRWVANARSCSDYRACRGRGRGRAPPETRSRE